MKTLFMKQEINTSFWVVFLLCIINLLVMHYYILIENQFLMENDIFNLYIENFLSCVFDVSLLYIVFYILLVKNINRAISLVFILTLVWSFSNVFYSRFYHQYLSLTSLEYSTALLDIQILKCLFNEIRWFDSYYVFSIFIFICFKRKIINANNSIGKVLVVLSISLIFDIMSLSAFCVKDYGKWYLRAYYNRHFTLRDYCALPSSSHFIRGSVRIFICDVINTLDKVKELSELQINKISSEINKTCSNMYNSDVPNNMKNIIFIIVESYMSFTSDKFINGREVTPFLNSLKNDSTVYYNGNMLENVTIGESSDGQFVYMTGLLPLRSSVTISNACKITLHGLPKLLDMDARMVIPTSSTMWKQDEMCRKYGFNNLYSNSDFMGEHETNLNDEQVFKLALQHDKTSKSPFLSVVLTMSTHQPYINQIDSTFIINNSDIPYDLSCYLNACHYMDKQLEKYINDLKRIGVYDNSIIVIASDHAVHNTDFGGVSKKLPLYIVNIPYEIKSQMWKGKCNQLDVYPTLLNLYSIKSAWCGLGQSLLSSNYNPIINENKWEISEWIIRGDYFAKCE